MRPREAGLQGDVILAIIIDETGKIVLSSTHLKGNHC